MDNMLSQVLAEKQGLDVAQSAMLGKVLESDFTPTEQFYNQAVQQKLAHPKSMTYKDEDGKFKAYLTAKLVGSGKHADSLKTPETTYKMLNELTSGDNPMFAMNDPDKQQVQQHLASFDTPEKVMQLQNTLGIKADGIVGKKTANALNNYVRVFGEKELNKNVAKAPVEKPDKNKIITELYDHFAIVEGDGDTTGAAPTGKRGLTTKLYNSLKKKYGNTISEEEASKLYLSEIFEKFATDLKGFSTLDYNSKKGIMDAAYNMGPNAMMSFNGFKKGVAENNPDKIFKNLLDTANIEGQSSKGLAKRRAETYNLANPKSKITKVVQHPNGTIDYIKNNKVYFSYRPKKGRHTSSSVGEIKI